MSIAEFIFGKKKYFEDRKLGSFTTRVRNENNVRKYVWKGSIAIPSYKNEVTILIEGDAFVPEKNQLETATWIIENTQELTQATISRIKTNSELKEKFKKHNLNDLQLDMICPSIEELYKFELSFYSISNDNFFITVLLDNKKITDIQ